MAGGPDLILPLSLSVPPRRGSLGRRLRAMLRALSHKPHETARALPALIQERRASTRAMHYIIWGSVGYKMLPGSAGRGRRAVFGPQRLRQTVEDENPNMSRAKQPVCRTGD